GHCGGSKDGATDRAQAKKSGSHGPGRNPHRPVLAAGYAVALPMRNESMRDTPLRDALVFGGSGQIGRAVLACLPADRWRVTAVSRREPIEGNGNDGGIRWLRGELDAPPRLPDRVDAVFSCGPLDGFARWYADAGLQAARVVAFGSTSVDT